jgi:hypothetical protein
VETIRVKEFVLLTLLIDVMGEEVALKKGAAVHFVIRPKPKDAN